MVRAEFQSKRQSEKVIFTPFTAVEVTDPADGRVDAILDILSDPNNSRHLIDFFRERRHVEARVLDKSGLVHLLGIEGDGCTVVGTATIVDQPQYKTPTGTINWTDHHFGSFAIRTDLQGTDTAAGRVGTRAFEAVFKWAFEDSRAYGKQIRDYLRLQTDVSVEGSDRMVRIAKRYGGFQTWAIPGVLRITHKKTGIVEEHDGVDYMFAIEDWVDLRRNNRCYSYHIEQHPIPL